MGGLSMSNIESHSSLAGELQHPYKVRKTRPEYYESLYGEIKLLDMTINEVVASKHLGNKPLMVVTAGRSFDSYARIPKFPVEEGNRIWLSLQNRLTTLSSMTTHVVSPHATHDIHMKDPQIVVNSILEIIRVVSANESLR